MKQPIKLAAPPDCKGRPDCEGGLKDVYGLDITEIVPLDFASAQIRTPSRAARSTLGETGTTDGTLDALGPRAARGRQGHPAGAEPTPAVNTDFLTAHPDIETLLNAVGGAHHR